MLDSPHPLVDRDRTGSGTTPRSSQQSRTDDFKTEEPTTKPVQRSLDRQGLVPRPIDGKLEFCDMDEIRRGFIATRLTDPDVDKPHGLVWRPPTGA